MSASRRANHEGPIFGGDTISLRKSFPSLPQRIGTAAFLSRQKPCVRIAVLRTASWTLTPKHTFSWVEISSHYIKIIYNLILLLLPHALLACRPSQHKSSMLISLLQWKARDNNVIIDVSTSFDKPRRLSSRGLKDSLRWISMSDRRCRRAEISGSKSQRCRCNRLRHL